RPAAPDRGRGSPRGRRNRWTRTSARTWMFSAAARARNESRGDDFGGGGMSHVEGIAEIVLWAADIEVTLAFYRENFGFELISPAQIPNKFLRVAEPGLIPQMIVLVPHPYPDD